MKILPLWHWKEWKYTPFQMTNICLFFFLFKVEKIFFMNATLLNWQNDKKMLLWLQKREKMVLAAAREVWRQSSYKARLDGLHTVPTLQWFNLYDRLNQNF